MEKSEVIQTRVDEETRRRLEDLAESNDESISGYLRQLIDSAMGTDRETSSLRADFLADIATISREFATERPLTDILEDSWTEITKPTPECRDLVTKAEGTVFIAGQGSSHSVARWFAARLTEQGVDAFAGTAEEIPEGSLSEDDVLFYISQSGETRSICEVAERVDESVSTICFSSTGSRVDTASDITIPSPSVSENVRPYATKSVLVQFLVLQSLFLDESPAFEKIEDRLYIVENFIEAQLTQRTASNGEAAPSEPRFKFNKQGQFERAVQTINRESDLTATPLVASLGAYHPIGSEAVQKSLEFLHNPAGLFDIGSIRDGPLNILYRGDAILVSILPASESAERSRYTDYLFNNDTSISRLLTENKDPSELRLITFRFDPSTTIRAINPGDDSDDELISRINKESVYGRDGQIQLPSFDTKTNDLLMLVSIYLLICRIFIRRWDQDMKLRQEVIRGPRL